MTAFVALNPLILSSDTAEPSVATGHGLGYISRQIRKFRRGKFDTWKNESFDSCNPYKRLAVAYMSCMHESKLSFVSRSYLSVLKFRFFSTQVSGVMETAAWHGFRNKPVAANRADRGPDQCSGPPSRKQRAVIARSSGRMREQSGRIFVDKKKTLGLIVKVGEARTANVNHKQFSGD